MTDFQTIWDKAHRAGEAAAQAQNASMPPEQQRGLDCGFAYITMPSIIPFARWAKKAGLASKNYRSVEVIWYSEVHSVPTQSISVHEAAVRAAAEVLRAELQTEKIRWSSQLA